MTQMPAALAAALREPAHRSALTRATLATSRVRPGDLRFASGLRGESVEPRLVLVLSVDDQLEFADVLLLHTATEMACDVDLVVPTSVSGAPYDVVVETDLRGVIWTIQLGSAVGHVDGALMTLRPDSTTSDGAFRSDVHSGPQLAGPTDPRWNFKRDEGVALRALARGRAPAPR